MKRVLVIHGPNLNLLGQREVETYGETSLEEINKRLKTLGRKLGLKVETFQSNHEGELVEKIQKARGHFQAIVINPAAYTHTSVAIRDALSAVELPVVEVHLTNLHRRETFRRRSLTAQVVVGQIMGFGPNSYLLALRAVAELLEG